MMNHTDKIRRSKGFTLIELLTVIAIIAILAAILFPVFYAVREKARQGTALSNLQKISSALAKYKLDHHQYPDVLFGYAYPGSSMQGGKAAAGAAEEQYFPGLYPLYITDPTVFTDPNNKIDIGKVNAIQSLQVNTLNGSGGLTPSTKNFYAADAFDSNPTVQANKTFGPFTVRYQRAWTAFPAPAGTDGTRELAYPNPDASAYVTCTTYHAGTGIGQGKVIVLFQSGNAEVIDDSTFLATGPDGGATPTFWTVKP